jgi:hypothetical protein
VKHDRGLVPILNVACALTLTSLSLMVWSLFDPRPIPVIVSMSLGQLLGTLSLASFGYVVFADLRAQILRRRAESMPPSKPPPQSASWRS